MIVSQFLGAGEVGNLAMFQPTAQVYRTITYQERMSYLVRTYHFNCLVMVSVQILSTCSIRSRNTLRAIMFSDS